jgi:hypothetical protein
MSEIAQAISVLVRGKSMQCAVKIKVGATNAQKKQIGAFSEKTPNQEVKILLARWMVPSGKWLEFGVARSPGNMKVSFQAARSIG